MRQFKVTSQSPLKNHKQVAYAWLTEHLCGFMATALLKGVAYWAWHAPTISFVPIAMPWRGETNEHLSSVVEPKETNLADYFN